MAKEMDEARFLRWCEEKELFSSAKKNRRHFEHVLRNCLNAEDEVVLLIGDKGIENNLLAPLMTLGYYLGAEEMGLAVKVGLQGVHNPGEMMDKTARKLLLNHPMESVVVVNVSKKLGKIFNTGKGYRQLMAKKRQRFASFSGLGSVSTNFFPQLVNALDVDYGKMQKKAEEIKNVLDAGEKIHITTPAGTDFAASIKGKTALKNDGNFSQPGSGGNFPCGEVYLPPRGKTLNGKIVIDETMRYQDGSKKVDRPIELIVENGSIASIKGGKDAEKLEESLKAAKQRAKFNWGIRRIGEIGIGINPRIEATGLTVLDEKRLGSGHIGIGSNHWFGGTIYAIIHFDQVFKDPIIEVDGQELRI